MARWYRRRATERRQGQALVEFSFVVPVFLLFIFGLIQLALLYFANSALMQAATDAAQITAAQSSSGPLDANGAPNTADWPNSYQGDGPALLAITNALTGQNAYNITEVDIYPADSNGRPQTLPYTLTASQDLASTATPGAPLHNTSVPSFTVENIYRLSLPANGTNCQIGRFYLQNSLAAPGASTAGYFEPSGAPPASYFSAWDQITTAGKKCVLPWNDTEYSYKYNQNGRDDQRCSEPMATVKITYSYHPLFYPLIPAVTLAATDETPLEPRTFTQDITDQQNTTCSQFNP